MSNNMKKEINPILESFSKFLEIYDPELHERYVLERYKAGSTGKGTRCPNPKFKFNKPVFK